MGFYWRIWSLALDGTSTGYGSSYVPDDTTLAMDSANAIGAKWMRIWLFEAGQGLTIDGNGYVASVLPDFWSNLDDVMAKAKNSNVLIYPTLFTSPPGQADGDMSKFANWFTDPQAQTAMLNNAVLPLVQRYSDGPIAAWQLYNEMNGKYWFTNPYWQGSASSTYVSNADARTWISAMVSAIKGVNGNFKVSTSQMLCDDAYHPPQSNNNDYVGTGLDFYDIHVYSDNGADLIPASDLGLDGPVILGEFGEITAEGPDHQSQVLQNFLATAVSGGWSGALYWTLGSQYPTAAQNAGLSCPDAQNIYSLFNCEGQPVEAYTTFQSFNA
ncbi:glycoside hydrolase family 5 protein [Athelia psychrophila]|uniref:Glycoside hydrolase family 5 protein n=1 Tax=Athelia psychrophila TaxID=1759441 RepID=A0A166TWH6_9AGAM|nr:glycoside hydrolase family 5 protein [Fibularhizoctonia sp. CBS 109695]